MGKRRRPGYILMKHPDKKWPESIVTPGVQDNFTKQNDLSKKALRSLLSDDALLPYQPHHRSVSVAHQLETDCQSSGASVGLRGSTEMICFIFTLFMT